MCREVGTLERGNHRGRIEGESQKFLKFYRGVSTEWGLIPQGFG